MNQQKQTRYVARIKNPAYCSAAEIDVFYELVLKGGKVSRHGLRQRILGCELLAFSYSGGQVIAVSSIKRPATSYKQKVIADARIDRRAADLTYEIGYSFTEEDFRKKGISSDLKSKLLKEMITRRGIIFCTTAIKSSQKFLLANGFEQRGQPYEGDNDKDIVYFERTL